MIQMISRAKRQISYLLVYAMVITVIQPFVSQNASAANSKKLYGAGMTFLQPADISTEAGIVITGAGVVVIKDNAYELVSMSPDAGGETVSGGGTSAAPGETPGPAPEETPGPVPEETPSPVPEETPSPVPEETPSAVPEETPGVTSGGSAGVTSGESAGVASGGSTDIASGGDAYVITAPDGGTYVIAAPGEDTGAIVLGEDAGAIMTLGEDADAIMAPGDNAGVTSGGGANVTSSGGTVIATGAAVTLRYGLSTEFTIGRYGAPAMFRLSNGKQSGNCAQFRVVSSASEGFYAWLVDGDTKELMYRVDGLGGQNVWRVALEQSHNYYLLLSGKEGSSGKLLVSDIMDDHGDTFNQATMISLNRDQSIEIEVGGDIDMLAFNAVAAVSTYKIQIDSVLGNGGTYTLYDHTGKVVSGCSGTMGTSRITKTFSATPSARYYFGFSSDQVGRKIVVRIIQIVTNYKITYHLNGGKNASGNIKSYTSTLSKFALKNATRSKYLFGGWYTDLGCTRRIYNIYGSNRKNFNLYAKWIPVSPKKPSITYLKSKKIKQIKLKWKKQTGVKGYQVVYGTTRSLTKKVKKKKLKKTNLTLKKMKPGEVYYFKIRAYALDSKGKKIYSEFSKVKKVKVKAKSVKKKKAKAGKKKAAKKKAATP